ncbi:hypothetical protein CSB69_3088 [Morganella morganii]|nr:hypothetical protein CSB69_3088 [Morganella morganii]EMP53478.1 hypothetical protein C790_01669 [Morganella morganii SC01]
MAYILILLRKTGNKFIFMLINSRSQQLITRRTPDNNL